MPASLPPLHRIDFATNSPVSVYMKAMAAVCPFVEPAVRGGYLHGCVVTPDCRNADDIHSRFFEQLVPQIERFRDARAALVEKQQRLLICHTVVIHTPAHLDAEVVRLLNWPNWLGWALKHLYTPKEIVFGFVRKNVVEKSFFGQSIPVSPFHGIVIRSRVVGSDQRFFTGNQPLLDAMMQAEDDGQNAHAVVPGEAVDIREAQAMRDANYFLRVRKWGQTILPAGEDSKEPRTEGTPEVSG
jgi:hypothetical protein